MRFTKPIPVTVHCLEGVLCVSSDSTIIKEQTEVHIMCVCFLVYCHGRFSKGILSFNEILYIISRCIINGLIGIEGIRVDYELMIKM